jgi:acyl-CoA reductase-like NAD-dependent aldehyde dehydrogenase
MSIHEPLFGLEDEDLKTLEPYLEPVRFAAESCLFNAGEEGDCCFFIDKGTVRVELPHPELDSDGVLGFLEAGSVIGELALLDRQPRSASAYADSDVECRKLSTDVLEKLTRDDPRVGITLVSALGQGAAKKLRSANKLLSDMVVSGSDSEVDELIDQAIEAQKTIADWPEEKIDALLTAIAQAFADKAQEHAELAVRVTRMGNVHDKTVKNRMASLGVLESLLGRPASGIVARDQDRLVSEFAAPVGVVFGMIPVTNPIATAIFKALICIKSRNALILSFHRTARDVAEEVGPLLQQLLREHGAPEHLVQWVRHRSSRKKTELFMHHDKVSLILATGGASMVKAAYSSGTPSLGVGPANAPALICSDADVDHAAASVLLSKSFDNGLICGAEHNLVVVESIRDAFVRSLRAQGAAVLDEEESARFTEKAVIADKGIFRRRLIGRDPSYIAEYASIHRDHPIRLIVVPSEGVSKDNVYAREKMLPALSLFTVEDEQQGMEISLQLLQLEGTGHTAIIHTNNDTWVEQFSRLMPASRILVNSPGSHGVVGLTSGLIPSLTLGCGTFGSNSTTDNVTYTNLLNVKRVAYYMEPKMDLS